MARIHPQTCGKYEPVIAEMCESNTLIVPVEPSTCCWTPCQPKSPASVTTKEGTPIKANHAPCSAPIAAPEARTKTIPQYQAQLWLTTPQARSADERIITEPTERSISPSKSTSTIPIAIVPVTPI